MEHPPNESQIILAIQAIQKNPKLSYRQAAAIYNISRTTLQRRMDGKRARQDTRPKSARLTELEEKTLVRYILDLDTRGFAPRLRDVEDIANIIAESRDASRVGTGWASSFVKRQPELRTRFSRVYDYQRALCEDPEKIAGWFALFANLKAKYGI